jgi:hypothetical protein
MPVTKRTKKFENTKLKDVLKRRKETAKIKQKAQINAKRKERKAKDLAKADDLEGDAPKKPKSQEDASIGEMSMDQFFQGGFQLPELNKKDTKPKTGKRKRTPVEGKADGAAEDDSASESDSGDDMDAHKEQLAALAEKDPEFYKYLKDNDAELLDFAEDADLAEIDALSASEDEATPRKKQKSSKADKAESEAGADNEVSKKLVEKWRASMEEANSLRAMKEVVLAFRAAAHLNEDSGKQYKYTISDPDGMFTASRIKITSNLYQCTISCWSPHLIWCPRCSSIISPSKRMRQAKCEWTHAPSNSQLTSPDGSQPTPRSSAHSHPSSNPTSSPSIISLRTSPMPRHSGKPWSPFSHCFRTSYHSRRLYARLAGQSHLFGRITQTPKSRDWQLSWCCGDWLSLVMLVSRRQF